MELQAGLLHGYGEELYKSDMSAQRAPRRTRCRCEGKQSVSLCDTYFLAAVGVRSVFAACNARVARCKALGVGGYPCDGCSLSRGCGRAGHGLIRGWAENTTCVTRETRESKRGVVGVRLEPRNGYAMALSTRAQIPRKGIRC